MPYQLVGNKNGLCGASASLLNLISSFNMVPTGYNTQFAVREYWGADVKRVLQLFVLATILAVPFPALAGTLTRTFVSATGSDSNPCTTAAPCASFAVAYNAAAVDGIVAALDPGKYGPLTITHSITIEGNGWAAITAPVGSPLDTGGIVVNANSSDGIILRGLTIDGAGASGGGGNVTNGIFFQAGGSLTVDDCTIRNMSGVGLYFNSSGTTAQSLSVSNTTINQTAQQGLSIITGNTGTITASIVHSVLINNVSAVQVNAEVSGAIVAAIKDSVISNNQGAISSNAAAGTTANVTVTRTLIANNNVGVSNASATSTIWLAQSTVVDNGIPYDASQGPVKTYQDNYFAYNGASIGSLTNAAQQ